jgi:hypothetical protein
MTRGALPNRPDPRQVAAASRRPNVYTVLLILAIVALGAALAMVLVGLLAEPPQGYGLSFGDLFRPDTGPPAAK